MSTLSRREKLYNALSLDSLLSVIKDRRRDFRKIQKIPFTLFTFDTPTFQMHSFNMKQQDKFY